ncbi:MAG: crotonase/enoyl-CoA hydratase family protein [Deltaproteobacteria bacterium]|jgi:enoyl-CoA hydratase|nr:crotonase/enoyl-CoA hydratase family protein [Deltaproteobacteria bacterium]MBW2536963.1 crotonase/enoyl-CoA hydratase family protein [Deltaproteobacteria bacterium]
MSNERVRYELQDRVAILNMDDGKANALSHALIDELVAALDRAESEAGAVMIAGRPGKFCAGFDLKTMMLGVDEARELVRHGADMYLKIYELSLPVVMACTGHAVAGGAVLLMTGDTRVGVEGPFQIGLNEIAIGMPLPIFVQELAKDRFDPRHRVRATIHATLYSPAEAIDVGYLDEVVAPDSLLEHALTRAKTLAKLPTEPYAKTKRTMRAAVADHVRATLDADMAALTPPTG